MIESYGAQFHKNAIDAPHITMITPPKAFKYQKGTH